MTDSLSHPSAPCGEVAQENQQDHLIPDDGPVVQAQSLSNECVVCGDPHSFAWTDTHGVGACRCCGTPYTIFHYEGDKRVDKSPVCALVDAGVALAKRYWAETHRMVFPGCYDMGFLGGRSRTYSGASQEDMDAFHAWYDKQPEVIEARAAAIKE